MSGSCCDDNGGVSVARGSGGGDSGYICEGIVTLTSTGSSSESNATETSIATSWAAPAAFLSATGNVAFPSWERLPRLTSDSVLQYYVDRD